MRQIYLDNAATTFPKPSCVAEAMAGYINRIGVNVGRGRYATAYAAEELVLDTRERLAALFHAPDPRGVIFTSGATESINVLLKGLLHPGDRVLVSSLEHNAVMRPLAQLAARGVLVDCLPCEADGTTRAETVEALLTPDTRAVVITHASNVCGTLQPVERIGAICHRRRVYFIVDAAQTAGLCPLDIQGMGIDALAFAGHKALLGPQGIGGFVINPKLAEQIEPLVAGGTGSRSHSETMPDFLPDKFEAGTPNLPGIAGLNAALRWAEERGRETFLAAELALTERFLAGLKTMAEQGKLALLGRGDAVNRVGVISVCPCQKEQAEVAAALEERFGILVRGGLHCAPAAHRALGSYPAGSLRFSFGPANTPADVDAAITALNALL